MNQPLMPFIPPMIQNNYDERLIKIENELRSINEKLNILIKNKKSTSNNNSYIQDDDNLYMI